MALAKISVPRGSTIFLIEDMDVRVAWFEERLGVKRTGGYKINSPVAMITTSSPSEALAILENIDVNEIDLFFFDHDLGGAPYTPPFSTDIARFLVEKNPEIGKRVVIHSMNKVGSKNLQHIMPGAVYLPFGSFDIVLT
jgi:NAD+-processing family protein with receiver domain